MFKKVLLPISTKTRERSLKAVAAAIALHPEEIVLLHVLDPVPEMIGGKDRQQLQKEADDAVSSLFQEYESQITAANIHCTKVVDRGAPANIIVKIAENENVDLIVMFSDGRDCVTDMLLGSCTERVLRNTATTLLIIRK
ncbi:MAG: universal stress protein [Desulfovibrionaceae bacterium]|nr:universal stress protein [Desulfovibrionaceae bacterium]